MCTFSLERLLLYFLAGAVNLLVKLAISICWLLTLLCAAGLLITIPGEACHLLSCWLEAYIMCSFILASHLEPPDFQECTHPTHHMQTLSIGVPRIS